MVKELITAIQEENFEKAIDVLEDIIVKKTKACPPGQTRVGNFCKKLKDKEQRQRDCRKTPGMKWDGNRCVPMTSQEKRLAKLRAKKTRKTKAMRHYKTIIKIKK